MTKRKTTPHLPTGRPTGYRPEYAELVSKLAAFGATDRQMADVLQVTEQTFNNWKQAHPEFFESLKIAKDKLDSDVNQSLYRRAMGYSHKAVKIFYDKDLGKCVEHEYVEHYPPDSTALIFWLKNRQPHQWRDKQEISGPDGGDIPIELKISFVKSNGGN